MNARRDGKPKNWKRGPYGYGVTYRSGRKKPYLAKICVDKTTKHLGSFATHIEATKAVEEFLLTRSES